jgi:hypothetical protein
VCKPFVQTFTEVMHIWVVAFYYTRWLPECSDAGDNNSVVYKAHAIACIVPEQSRHDVAELRFIDGGFISFEIQY